METGFDRLGEDVPAGPVVLSVPHAGREYPDALRSALRVPPAALVGLEDRHVDLVARMARTTETMFVQRRARAWIDLNRGEDERDPRVDEGAASSTPALQSAKLRGGLGLIPRRAGHAGDLWRRRFSDAEVQSRIVGDHRPYHAALAAALTAARDRFGVAVLLDLHSMPPLGRGGAQVVFGDRFGRTAPARFVSRLEAVAASAGIGTALNVPYAGAHVLDRHADPAANIHAIQVELDRSLYLDQRLDQPGAGLEGMARLVRTMLYTLADEALGDTMRLAAE